ncbi:MAG: 2-C-methyl-D-erythritol 4-phosphate cytidylyltransferase [Finegoldia sp.]|nr:2-C-methyl-D-erythritol 4-phosphate cytidylyltransferase [Finegoldia sp.]
MYISAIIAAAGSSHRMGTKIAKQFLKIKEKMIIEYTLDTFNSIDDIDEIVLVIRERDRDIVNELIERNSYKNIKLVVGGDTRERSTYNGLKAVCDKTDIVICHDGARPFIKKEKILESINALGDYDGVVVAVKAKDTIKYVNSDMKIVNTPNRSNLYMAQTPQVFKYEAIKEAYKMVFDEKISVTDDSSLMEILGKDIRVIEGNYNNIKITTMEDLYLGEIIVNEGE